ncbi:MAG: glycosyltransferase family 1 protein [bacterium]|nr:glycosyltransferase family 1 protein [bacterium]
MKRIGIDARLYSQTGVGVYLQNLLFYLRDIFPSDVELYIYVMEGAGLKIDKGETWRIREIPYRWHSLGEQIGFLAKLNDDNLDLMHFTYFSYPVFYRRPFIATVHDVTPLLFKTGRASTLYPLLYEAKHLIFRQILTSQIQNARSIITPTHAVKTQLVELFGKTIESKIVPIYEGVNERLITSEENTKLKEKYDDFFIYIGNFYPHKNIEKLIKAFAKVRTEAKLILIGPKDFFYTRIDDEIKKFKMEGKIILYSNPTNEDLVFFYKNAKALIHPSLSEGFGLPIVEAMHFGLPIIASDIPVFKELIGESYFSFDPTDTENMAKAIERFLKEDKKKVDYASLLKKFSFKTMAQKTLDLYLSHTSLPRSS